MSDSGLTAGQEPAMMSVMDPAELAVVMKLLGSKLPPVLKALEQGGNGWKQVMTCACYLLAAVLNRHPEYGEAVGRLLVSFDQFYPEAEAAFARQQPGLVSELIKNDVVLIVLPDDGSKSSTDQRKTKN